jgi:transketolase
VRKAFIENLLTLASEDPNLWLLCGDIGYSVLEPFQEKFPGRYLNVGVAEQNMIGIAAGLALSSDAHVFCYSIGNFTTLRCLEQIRNDVCHHNLRVTVTSVGGGVAYGSHGYTHQLIEDLAIMRALPHLAIAAPGDPFEAAAATRILAKHKGPGYLRLGKAGEEKVHLTAPSMALGKALVMKEGDGICLLSTGGMLPTAKRVTEALAAQNINCGLVSLPFIKPFPEKTVAALAARYPLLATIEEHSVCGGLADLVGRIIAEHGLPARLMSFAIGEDALEGKVGDQNYLRQCAGLDADSIIKRLLAHS